MATEKLRFVRKQQETTPKNKMATLEKKPSRKSKMAAKTKINLGFKSKMATLEKKPSR